MIRFPKVHIAASVVNRILNVADGIAAQQNAAGADRSPVVPQPAIEGLALDANLAAPTPPVTADDATAQAITLKGLA